jgi:hypothetical protein
VLEPTQTYDDGAKTDVTDEAGTATGDVNESGTTIVLGTITIELECNEIMVLETTETITEAGTEFGTDDQLTMTVEDPTAITLEAANEVTNEAGTATTEVHESGTTTVDGITTTDEAGNEIMVLEITETITTDGTEAGTLEA